MIDWNKEINISKKLEVGIITLLWLLTLGVHWLISGFLYDVSNYNLEWTRMQMFGFLAGMSTMIFMVFIGLTIVRKDENPVDIEGGK